MAEWGQIEGLETNFARTFSSTPYIHFHGETSTVVKFVQ